MKTNEMAERRLELSNALIWLTGEEVETPKTGNNWRTSNGVYSIMYEEEAKETYDFMVPVYLQCMHGKTPREQRANFFSSDHVERQVPTKYGKAFIYKL